MLACSDRTEWFMDRVRVLPFVVAWRIGLFKNGVCGLARLYLRVDLGLEVPDK